MGILFKQERLGQHKKPFTIYKIRTMEPGADSKYQRLLETQKVQGHRKIHNDPRITRIGAVLRTYFIDELPQLYNIQRGEMKLVGIRPRVEYDWMHRLGQEHMNRALKHKPGLIGVGYYYMNIRDDQDIIQAETEYLRRKEQDPTVDRQYLQTILRNILCKGMRSS